MKTNTIKTIALLSLLGSFTVASAGILPVFAHHDDHRCGREGDRHCMSAPEIDPGSAMGALALLGGTVAILRGRRKK
jgi:hypothetical protein